MKKIINGVIALVICMGIVSCGTDSGYTAEMIIKPQLLLSRKLLCLNTILLI